MSSYAEAPQEIKDAVEHVIRTYGSDPALLAGALVSATVMAIVAAKAEEREACAAVLEDVGIDIVDRFAAAALIRKRGAP